jgi:hypothetical protein
MLQKYKIQANSFLKIPYLFNNYNNIFALKFYALSHSEPISAYLFDAENEHKYFKGDKDYSYIGFKNKIKCSFLINDIPRQRTYFIIENKYDKEIEIEWNVEILFL